MTWEEIVSLWVGRAVLWSGAAFAAVLVLSRLIDGCLRKAGIIIEIGIAIHERRMKRKANKQGG